MSKEPKMSEPNTLIGQIRKVMKGEKVLSMKVLYEKKPELPPRIQIPEAVSPTSSQTPTATSSITENRPGFLEPFSALPSSPVPSVNRQVFDEEMKKQQQEFWEWEARQPETWQRYIKDLETDRQRYNKMRGWSAMDLKAVELIDERIQECHKILNGLEEEEYYDEDSE